MFSVYLDEMFLSSSQFVCVYQIYNSPPKNNRTHIERRKILAAYGAEFILTPAKNGTDGAIEVAYDMAKREKEKWFMPDQFNNENNWMAHYNGTGVEIWEQTKGEITMFVAVLCDTGERYLSTPLFGQQA